MNNSGKIEMVSLGSGDPDNITIKALSALQDADVILNLGKSATSIVSRLRGGEELIKKSEQILVPMCRNREEALALYSDIAAKAFHLICAGKKVAMTTIGDAGTYSSVSYIYVLLSSLGVRIQINPGVPYYIATAAASCAYLTQQDEAMLILSEVKGVEQLSTAILKEKKVVVVMKLSSNEKIVKEFLEQAPKCHFIYSEYLGDPEKEVVFDGDLRRLLSRPFPYFSTIIINPPLNL